MIWFACKGCGKRHGRPDEAAGTLVFCPCGQGNRVPWESTVAAPEKTEAPAEPVLLPEPRPGGRWGDEATRGGRRTRPAARRRDPAYCFNHEETPSQQTCADCGEAFCERCVVTFQDAILCGPCKNFRLHSRERPPRPSTLAVASLVIALLGAPFSFCPTVMSEGLTPGPTLTTLVWGVVGMVAPLVALVLGFLGLREIEGQPRVGGRGVAITGMTTAAVGMLWSLTILIIVGVRQVTG
jgi:hypothetical protein